ncbi:uncharacterized protein LOC143368006 [Andrena cerasifolii]|uniref:uncharacterized protein LOC143368006 n=1 Tax=Andrena cerasifolii TaxID=2819439 RepID=UPI0040381394
MRLFMSCLVIALALCTSSFAYRIDDNYMEVHEIDPNTTSRSPTGQLPPQDPAVNSFLTAPLLPICTKEGYFRDPFNCRKFYYCQYPDAVPGAFYCQSPLIFNTVTNTCDHPEFVQC